MFKVIGTETYLKEVSKWPKQFQLLADKLPAALAENPLLGKPLGYPFLREKKIEGRRIYYLIYEDLKLVLLVATSGKKDQHDTIDHIQEHFDEYKQVAQEISKQVS
jgi:hypothetical protein